MDSIDFRLAIEHKMPIKINEKMLNKVVKPAAKSAASGSNSRSPLECYALARDYGHKTSLEKQILNSDNSWASYMYARNIKGANIRAHIQHISKDKKMDKVEQYVILEELSLLLNKTKGAQNE